MLSALDLARRIEAGELTPRAVVDLCAEAIAARESEVGAFVALDLDAARRAAENPRLRVDAAARPAGRRSRTFSTPPICRPNTARRSMPATGRAPTPPLVALIAPRRRHRARQDRDHRIRHRCSRQRPAIRTISRTRRAARRRARPRRVAAGMLPIAIGTPDRRLGDPAGGVLRRRRLQAVVPADADRRHEMRLLASRHRRAVRRRRRRRGLRRGRDHGPRPARRSRDAGGAAHRAGAHAICGRQASADDAERARKRRARSAQAAGASVRDVDAAADAWKTPIAPTPSSRTTKRAARSPSNTTAIATSSAKRCASSSSAAAAITADAYDDARRTASRARQALADLMADIDVILTPSAPGAAPHGPRLDRQSDLQPAVDPDGDALRQRAGAHEAACRSACRSSAASARPRALERSFSKSLVPARLAEPRYRARALRLPNLCFRASRIRNYRFAGIIRISEACELRLPGTACVHNFVTLAGQVC